MAKLYDNPKYYEIAFSFRDIVSEVDIFEECFERFSLIPVRSTLELSCGPSPHMEELVKRGYEYTGLDLSEPMLNYGKQKACNIGGEVNLLKANMVDFSLAGRVDFVFITLGSLYVKNSNELISHFQCVEKVLKNGGLYLLDWCIRFDALSNMRDSWQIEKNGVTIKTTVSREFVNLVEQTFEENILLEVDDNGRRQTFQQSEIRRAIYPQEFLCLINRLEHFEFVGWWNNWDLEQALEGREKVNRPITVVRRI